MAWSPALAAARCHSYDYSGFAMRLRTLVSITNTGEAVLRCDYMYVRYNM